MREAKGRILPQSASGVLTSMLRNEAGTILPMLAIAMLVLMALVGGGVDIARGYKAERRLQAACDAGVLAGRRTVTTNGLDATAIARARQYFTANFDAVEQNVNDVVFTPTTPDEGDTVEGVASGNLHTLIVAVFGFEEIPLSVSCSASMGMGNADIVFVLDNTYSMTLSAGTESRISALKNAMKNFYTTVQTSVGGSNARIRYGFVPYATTVNVGEILRAEDASYIADSITVPSIRLVRWNTAAINSWSNTTPTYTSTSTVSDWANTGSQYSNPNGDSKCQNALPSPNPTAWTNYGDKFINTTTYSVVPTSGNQLKTMGMRQEQRYTEYRCSNRYRQTKVYRRYQQTVDYEERTVNTTAPDNTTTGTGVAHDKTFADAILQNRTFSTIGYKTGASTAIPVGVTTSSTLKSKYNANSTWAGCIAERQTTAASTFAFVSLLTGITPSTATDLDIDTAPTADNATKWAPLWPEVTYIRNTGIAFQGLANADAAVPSRESITNQVADTYCPYKSQLLAEMTQQAFNNYVGFLETSSLGTYHDTGLLWGARLSSPTGIFADNVNEDPDNGATVSRHVIFMTDGTPQPTGEVNGMYGIESVLQRITGTWSNTTVQSSRHQARAWAICEAIKARGIRLWVIAFGTPLTDELELRSDEPGDTGCSSPDSAFTATNSAALNTHFQEIANQVGELRVTQ